jgi:hypothetical protein
VLRITVARARNHRPVAQGAICDEKDNSVCQLGELN